MIRPRTFGLAFGFSVLEHRRCNARLRKSSRRQLPALRRCDSTAARTCCSSATLRRPATRRRRSACVTGRASSASASCRFAECHDQRRPAAAAARGGRARGARSMVIGVANVGGRILDSWVPSLLEALEAGLDIISGMHARLADTPALVAAASAIGRRLIDVRTPPRDIPIASGRKRSGKRLLDRRHRLRARQEVHRAGDRAGVRAARRGRGFSRHRSDRDHDRRQPACRWMRSSPTSRRARPRCSRRPPRRDHWDVIEGQGSLFHPAYAGVSLGLLHGSQPDVIVVCHEPGRTHILGHAHSSCRASKRRSSSTCSWADARIPRSAAPA